MSVFVLQSSAQGTVPYLGIFLTDLTMLDAAVKDRLEVRHTHTPPHRTRPTWRCSYTEPKNVLKTKECWQFFRTAISTSTNDAEWVLCLFIISLLNISREGISCAEMDFFSSLKEFEVLAQIRLLQSSCRNSTFRTDVSFVHWYHSVPTLTEEARWALTLSPEWNSLDRCF